MSEVSTWYKFHLVISSMVCASILMQVLTFFWSIYLRWTPHPVIVTIRDNRDYIRVLVCSYYTTITGWGVLLRYTWAAQPGSESTDQEAGRHLAHGGCAPSRGSGPSAGR